MILLLVTLFLGTSCARLKYAWNKEAKSAHVWAPLIVAGAMQIDGADSRISRWAREQNPIFGDQDNAEIMSDKFNDVLEYESYASLLLSSTTPKDSGASGYFMTKGKELITMEVGVRGSYWSAMGIKVLTKRERPLKQNNESFPSGHGTAAGAWKSAANNNIASWDSPVSSALNIVNHSLAFSTLWARIEAGKHYPSDVLVGYALGTFITNMVWSTVMMPEASDAPMFTFTPMSGGGGLTYFWGF